MDTNFQKFIILANDKDLQKLLVIYLLSLVAFLSLLAILWRSTRKWLWESTTATITITKGKLISRTIFTRLFLSWKIIFLPDWEVYAHYEYQVNGQIYTGSFYKQVLAYDQVTAFDKKYPKGKQVTIYYNKANFSQSVMKRSPSVALIVLFFMCSLFALFLTL